MVTMEVKHCSVLCHSDYYAIRHLTFLLRTTRYTIKKGLNRHCSVSLCPWDRVGVTQSKLTGAQVNLLLSLSSIHASQAAAARISKENSGLFKQPAQKHALCAPEVKELGGVWCVHRSLCDLAHTMWSHSNPWGTCPLSKWDFCWVVKSGVRQVDWKTSCTCGRFCTSWGSKPAVFLNVERSKRFRPSDEPWVHFPLFLLKYTFLLFSSFLTLTQSIPCQPWQAAHVYVCAAPAEPSRWNWVKESSGLESEHMTCSLNTLRNHIFALWVTIMFPPHLHSHPFSCAAIPGSPLCCCCRLFLGGRDQSQAKVINPHHGKHQQLGE